MEAATSVCDWIATPPLYNGSDASGILGMLSRDVLCVALPAVIIGMVGSWYTNGFWMDLFAEQAAVSGWLYVLVCQ